MASIGGDDSTCEDVNLKELNESIDELSIHDDDADRNIPETSTPVKARRRLASQFGEPSNEDGVEGDKNRKRGTKHDLTPGSKQNPNQPKSKRFLVGGKPSGKEVAQRRATLEGVLTAGFVQEDGFKVSPDSVLVYADLGIDSATLLTRTVKHVFPRVSTWRDKDGTTFYVNLRAKNDFSCTTPECSTSLSAEMANIQQKLLATEEVMRQAWERLRDATEGMAEVQVLLAEFTREARERDQLMKTLLNNFETELANAKVVDHARLTKQQTEVVVKELKTLEEFCNLGVRSCQDVDVAELISPTIFQEFVNAVSDKCPLLRNIVETLVISNSTERNVNKTNEQKLLSGHHALALLLNTRNSKCLNDFPLLFGLLCVSYGAGKSFINMLQSVGMSLHYNSLKNFMSRRMANFEKILEKHAPSKAPVILLMDNINMYRGKARHHRLFKTVSPKMWNFTVRGAIIPNCSGLEELLQNKETCQLEQKDVSTLKAADLFIDSNPEHLKVFEGARDQYLVNLLDVGLNQVHPSEKEIGAMTEPEFHAWLKNCNLQESNSNYKFQRSAPKRTHQGATKTIVLPLSLENNATITGTAAILEHFGQEFTIPCAHEKVVLPYDESKKSFDIAAARKHHEFLYSLQEHKEEMIVLQEHLTSLEKQLPDIEKESEEQDVDEEEPPSDGRGAVSFQKIDGKFKKIFNKLTDKMWNANQSVDAAAVVEFKQYLHANRSLWEKASDHHGCTVIHHAVQNGNLPLVQTLINAGVNPNVKERCGATPLTLAVIKGDEKLVRLLLENFAICNDWFYTSVPGPKHIAEKLGLQRIHTLIDSYLTREKEIDISVWEATELSTSQPPVVDNVPIAEDVNTGYDRSIKKCRTLVVGDQGTNKIIRSVKDKSSAYEWAAEIPGDLHTRGYLYEVCKKTMGPGGFMCVAQTVMNREKVTDDAFGDKKFQHQNLNRIDEAVRDVAMAYGIAAVPTFKESEFFPSQETLVSYEKVHGNHHELLLSSFKEWIEHESTNVQFRYHSQIFTLFGPLRELYLSCIKCGDGVAREAVWMVMLPLFAQAQKRNYWTEAFVHVVNLIGAWPIATRMILQNNCSVSVKGREGHNIALDEWVESYLVQPLKNYATGHTSVEILKLLTVNLDAIGAVRNAYGAQEAFNVHPTSHHSEADPFPDQLKGMWFCLKQKFFDPPDDRDYIPKLSNKGDVSGKVSLTLVDLHEKGKRKVSENFGRKLFNSYHILPEGENTVNHEPNEEMEDAEDS